MSSVKCQQAKQILLMINRDHELSLRSYNANIFRASCVKLVALMASISYMLPSDGVIYNLVTENILKVQVC